jgi:2-polyprenyl-3-methyl-5-hydroxy-6-metoxy-1,4-benzoquinol methylase
MYSPKNLFRFAAKYYDVDPRGVHADDIPFYIEFAKEIDAERILELGCGTGRVSIPLAKSGFLVNGINLSKEMLEVFSSKLKNMDRNVQNNKLDV